MEQRVTSGHLTSICTDIASAVGLDHFRVASYCISPWNAIENPKNNFANSEEKTVEKVNMPIIIKEIESIKYLPTNTTPAPDSF